jgi:hypothetical protein
MRACANAPCFVFERATILPFDLSTTAKLPVLAVFVGRWWTVNLSAGTTPSSHAVVTLAAQCDESIHWCQLGATEYE